MSKNDSLMVTFWWFFFHQKTPKNGFKDVSARFRTTLAFFWSSLGAVLRQNACKIHDFEPKPLHNSTNIGSLELKTKYQKMLQKRSKVLQNHLIWRPRAFLIGFRATRRDAEVLSSGFKKQEFFWKLRGRGKKDEKERKRRRMWREKSHSR